jgi:hypothetical protein
MRNARLTRWSFRVGILDRHGNGQERAVLRLGVEAESSGHPALDAETLSGSGEGRVDSDVDGGEGGRLVGEVVLDEGRVCVELGRGGVPEKPSDFGKCKCKSPSTTTAQACTRIESRNE